MCQRVCTGQGNWPLCAAVQPETQGKRRKGKGLLPPAFQHSRCPFFSSLFEVDVLVCFCDWQSRGERFDGGWGAHERVCLDPLGMLQALKGTDRKDEVSVSANLAGGWLTSQRPSKCDLGRTFNEIHSTWQAPPLPGLSVWSPPLFQSDCFYMCCCFMYAVCLCVDICVLRVLMLRPSTETELTCQTQQQPVSCFCQNPSFRFSVVFSNNSFYIENELVSFVTQNMFVHSQPVGTWLSLTHTSEMLNSLHCATVFCGGKCLFSSWICQLHFRVHVLMWNLSARASIRHSLERELLSWLRLLYQKHIHLGGWAISTTHIGRNKILRFTDAEVETMNTTYLHKTRNTWSLGFWLILHCSILTAHKLLSMWSKKKRMK